MIAVMVTVGVAMVVVITVIAVMAAVDAPVRQDEGRADMLEGGALRLVVPYRATVGMMVVMVMVMIVAMMVIIGVVIVVAMVMVMMVVMLVAMVMLVVMVVIMVISEIGPFSGCELRYELRTDKVWLRHARKMALEHFELGTHLRGMGAQASNKQCVL